MESHKIFALLVLHCAQLNLVFNAPPWTKQEEAAGEGNVLGSNNTTNLLGNGLQLDLFNGQDIVFPDFYESLKKVTIPIEESLKCADGLTLCENIPTYPYSKLKETLNKTNLHSEFFGVDQAPSKFSDRIDDPNESFICDSVETTIYPKAGRNKNNKWKYIINQGETEGYIQGIRIEKCTVFDGPCNLASGAPVGYVATCKQKYILRRLLSLKDNGQPAPDSFQIPSACCCAFKKDFTIFPGFGRHFTRARPLKQ